MSPWYKWIGRDFCKCSLTSQPSRLSLFAKWQSIFFLIPLKRKIFHTFVKLHALNHKLFFPPLPLSESMQKWLPQSFFNITFILGKCIFKKLFIFHSMSGCYIVLVKIKLLYKLLCTFACITFSYKYFEVGFSQVLGVFILNITLYFILALFQILRNKYES